MELEWHPEAVWLEPMWVAIDLRTGRAVPDAPFPEALRQAAAHRVSGAAAFAGYGHTLVETFPAPEGDARTPPARRILATYTCISAAVMHGEGATYRAHYTDGTGRLQWIKFRWDTVAHSWLPSNVHFVAFPEEPRPTQLGSP